MFHSLVEVVMVKIKCRDSSKIPYERLFELEGKMSQIRITVELPLMRQVEKVTSESGSDDGNDGNQQSREGDMETDKGNAGSDRMSNESNANSRSSNKSGGSFTGGGSQRGGGAKDNIQGSC